jgi:predicted Mrr-cat superfamily restriction endonuclease
MIMKAQPSENEKVAPAALVKNLWVIRPEPNFVNRLDVFLREGIVAIGWPAVGNLSGLNREALTERLSDTYSHYRHEQKSDLAVAAGVLDRFVNHIIEGDIVLVPHESDVYLAKVLGPYEYHSELSQDGPKAGYPHWHKVAFLNSGDPLCRIKELPLGVRRSIDCRLTVFSIHSAARAMWGFLNMLKVKGLEGFLHGVKTTAE